MKKTPPSIRLERCGGVFHFSVAYLIIATDFTQLFTQYIFGVFYVIDLEKKIPLDLVRPFNDCRKKVYFCKVNIKKNRKKSVEYDSLKNTFVYNTKIKKYKNGATNTIVCRVPIWNVKKEKSKDINLNDIFELLVPLEDIDKPEKQKIIRHDSIKRAIDSIFDYALNNSWDYFLTFTFNPKLIDSYDCHKVTKSCIKWLSNQVQRYNISYLAVPEFHKSGRIHFHALIRDNSFLFGSHLVPSGHFYNSKIIYNCDKWRYGWSTAIPTDGNYERLARYVVKYMTKDLQKVCKHFYYKSNDLEKPDIEFCNSDYDALPFLEFNGFKYFFEGIKKDKSD